MKFIFHPLAEEEYENSANWYKDQSLKQEKRFIRNVLDTIIRITDNPNLFQKVKGEKRAAKVKSFPFSVIFITEFDYVFIVSIFHNSRNPNIWKNR
jgi:plasmid stabilization system protein ParE